MSASPQLLFPVQGAFCGKAAVSQFENYSAGECASSPRMEHREPVVRSVRSSAKQKAGSLQEPARRWTNRSLGLLLPDVDLRFDARAERFQIVQALLCLRAPRTVGIQLFGLLIGFDRAWR